MKKSYFQIILAALMWGIMGLFVRKLTSLGITRMQIALLRVLVAVVFMIPVVFFRNKRFPKIHLRDLWCFVGTGVFSLTIYNLCYFTAIQYMTLSVAAVFTYTSPAFVIIFSSLLFGEKITISRLLSLILVFSGCVLVTGVIGGGAVYVTFAGILYGLGAGLSYALYSIFGRFALNRGYHTLTITFYTFLFSLIGCVPFADIDSLIANITPMVWIYAAGLGTICCLLPYLLYTKGLCGIDNGTASIFSTLETVVATLIGVFFYNEVLTWNNMIGIALLFVGISIPVYAARKCAT